MAKPQIEDGYTAIANELVEAFARINLTPYESRIMWTIFRKTYGWHKKSDRISFTQFFEVSNIPHNKIVSTLKKLQSRNIIISNRDNFTKEYSLQKDYTKWDINSDQPVTDPLVTDQPVTDPLVTDQPVLQPVTNQSATSDQPVTILTSDHVVTNKNNKILTKDTLQKQEYIIQNKILDNDFIIYFISLKDKFPTVEYDNEFIKFKEYWDKKARKPLKLPKTAWHNWLKNCIKYQTENKGNGHKSTSKFQTQPTATQKELEKEWN